MLGHKSANKVVEQKVVSHNEFYWIVQCESQKELNHLVNRSVMGDILIKKFYRQLIKWIDRANKLCDKLGKGTDWVKRWIIKKIRKTYKNDERENGFVKQVEELTREDLKGRLIITDREEIELLLQKELIRTELL